MPRHDWYDDNDETMSRDRGEHRMRDREYGDRGAMFGRHRDEERGRGGRIGGWGGLMGEDMDRERMDRDRMDRERMYDRDRSRDRDRQRMGRRDEEHGFGPDDYNRGIPMDETERLIASNKVEGTPVYDRHGDKLGTIHNFMVEKRKGEVVYAVLKHGGGFLGLNERYYPLEWNQLTYDTRLGGYHARLDEDDLKSFGSFDSDGRWHSRAHDRHSDRHRDRRRESDMREPW